MCCSSVDIAVYIFYICLVFAGFVNKMSSPRSTRSTPRKGPSVPASPAGSSSSRTRSRYSKRFVIYFENPEAEKKVAFIRI
jgi:hypothetical protein